MPELMERPPKTTLNAETLEKIAWCYRRLEHPSLAARLSDMLGSPIDAGVRLLPKTWQAQLSRASQASIEQALTLALGSLSIQGGGASRDWMHRVAVAGTGAAGGFFGPLAVLTELPLSTTLMLRSIAQIAHSQGEDVRGSNESRLACIQVFALGGRSPDDKDAELGYYGLRMTLGLHFEPILEYVGTRSGPHIPGSVQVARAVAARFGVVVSDKVAAQLVPILGALSGAALNLAFMQHYQDVAHGHFLLRRLERDYGELAIRDAYRAFSQAEAERERASPLEGW